MLVAMRKSGVALAKKPEYQNINTAYHVERYIDVASFSLAI